MKQPDWKFSPSLLQAFQDYMDSEALYEKFYGFSEEPELTYQEYERLRFRELIDKVNRVPFVSEAADRGSCLNEVVDCIVMKVPSTRDDISVKVLSSDVMQKEGAWDEKNGKALRYARWFESIRKPCIWTKKDGFEFYFDTEFCRSVARYFSGSLCQVYTEACIDTDMGRVMLYGYPDYVRGDRVFDLKTTGRYDFGKYAKYWQRHVYPWALIESGKCESVSAFEFTAFAMKGGTAKSPLIYGEMFPEHYAYDHTESTRLLRGVCEQFARFLDTNRALITDEKIFGGERKAQPSPSNEEVDVLFQKEMGMMVSQTRQLTNYK